MKPTLVALAALTVVLCAPLRARADAPATPSPTPSPSGSPAGVLREITRVVTTSDRKPERAADTSRPTFVVDRARIDEYGARTVADALKDVPGVDLFSYGPFGAQVDYAVRGGSSTQTLVLVDGVAVTNPTTGTVSLGEFSTIGVDRIEVVESGSSTLYGTSASSGVINIVTKVPRGVYVDAFDASYGERDVRVGGGNGIIGLTLERHVSTGDVPYPAFDYGPQSSCAQGFIAPCAFAAGVRAPAYGDQSAGRLSLDVPLPAGITLRARADASATQIGVPGGLTFLTTTASEADQAGTAQFSLARTTRRSTLTLDLAASSTRSGYTDPVSNFGQSDVYTGRSQISLRDAFTAGRVDGVAGVDLSRESGVLSFPTTPNFSPATAPPIPAHALGASQAQSAAYAQAGVAPFAALRLVAGVRGENDSPHGRVLAPSFGGTVRSGQFAFSGNVGESFRVPTLDDLYYPGFANPRLLPEKAQTADTTVSYEGRDGSLSAGWFDRNGSNFIIAAPPKYVPFNAERAAVAGIQITAVSTSRLGYVAQIGYTALYRALDVRSGGRLPDYPAGNVDLTLDHPFAETRVNYGLRWDIVGSDGADREAVAGPLVASYDTYDTLDAYVRFKLAPNTVLSLRGFNLGNEYAAPIFGYPSAGRRYAVEVSTR